MSDVLSRIKELQAEFQHVADHHHWLALVVPSAERRLPWIGQIFAPAHYPDFGVGPPSNPANVVIADHVQSLTNAANQLLMTALKRGHSLPQDIAEQIHEESQRDHGLGWWAWVRWLRYSVPLRSVTRFANYAQTAATALRELADYCNRVSRETAAPKAAVVAERTLATALEMLDSSKPADQIPGTGQAKADGGARPPADDPLAKLRTLTTASVSQIAGVLGQPYSKVESFLRRLREKKPSCVLTSDPDVKRVTDPAHFYRIPEIMPDLERVLARWTRK